MTSYEIFNIIISILSLLIGITSFCTALYSRKAAENSAKSANLVDKGMIEMQIRQSINQAANRKDDLMIRLQADPENKALKLASESAIENWINTYDEACGLYIDEKIDQDRFKKNYFHEITELVDDKSFEEYFSPEFKSRYQKMLIVYKKWTIMEFVQ